MGRRPTRQPNLYWVRFAGSRETAYPETHDSRFTDYGEHSASGAFNASRCKALSIAKETGFHSPLEYQRTASPNRNPRLLRDSQGPLETRFLHYLPAFLCTKGNSMGQRRLALSSSLVARVFRCRRESHGFLVSRALNFCNQRMDAWLSPD